MHTRGLRIATGGGTPAAPRKSIQDRLVRTKRLVSIRRDLQAQSLPKYSRVLHLDGGIFRGEP